MTLSNICDYQYEYLTILLFFHLYSCAKVNLKKVSLELGGKSPLIIFSDCDMDKAVRMVRRLRVKVDLNLHLIIIRGNPGNSGQRVISERIL